MSEKELHKVTIVRMVTQTCTVVVEAEDTEEAIYEAAWDKADEDEHANWEDTNNWEAQDEIYDSKVIEPLGPEDIPKPGDIIWVDSSYYIDRGQDDVCGGMATVEKTVMSLSAGDDTPFVYVKEHPGRGVNWHILGRMQEDLIREFGSKRAHPCPDNG